MSVAGSSVLTSAAAGSANSAKSCFGRSDEECSVPSRRPGCDHVAVAVDAVVIDRKGQERRAAPEHHRPSGDLGGPGREEAPTDLAHGPGRGAGVEGESPDGAVDSNGHDHEVVFATRSVAEFDRDAAGVLGEALHR